MAVNSELIVFIIQAIFKTQAKSSTPLINLLNTSNSPSSGTNKNLPQRASAVNTPLEDQQMSLDEFDCIENFKMARRCTI